MVNLKKLIKEQKNIVLAIIAVGLIILTAYQLKLIGIAITEDVEFVEATEMAQNSAGIAESLIETENVAQNTTNIANNDISQNIAIDNVVQNTVANTVSNTISNEISQTTNSTVTNIAETNTVSNKTQDSVVANSISETEKSETTNTISNTVAESVIDNSIVNEVPANKVVTNEIASNTTLDTENTVKIENTVAEEILPDPAPEEIVEAPTELAFNNGEYKVIVSAITENALKDIKSVNVTPITAENNAAEYNNISIKLQDKVEAENQVKSEEAQEELLGFLAYDITLVNEQGMEVEPDGNVNVSFEYLTIPEKVAEYSNADVSLVHFEEDKISGNILLKEFSEGDPKLSVETNDANQIKKLEFETTSFSTFTIKWSTSNRTANIVVHYVDENGNELQGTRTTTVNATTETYTFANYASTINGYSYKEARLNSTSGDIVTTVRFSSSNYRYTITFSNGTTQTISRNGSVSYDVYLVYETENSGKASSSIPVGSTVSIQASNVSGLKLTDLIGFSWVSQDSSIATVTVDGGTGVPTAKGVKAGTTTIVGTRSVDGTEEKINWSITIENKVVSQIIFEHQNQNNTDFAKQDNYRPYAEYGFGSTEPTNIIKFVVVLADSDGKLNMNGSLPNVELPEGSIVPDSYVFDLGPDRTLSIEENTFDGISVPGYSYDGAYAYFGWNSNSDTDEMAQVDTFRNFGKVSTNFPRYYSVIGFTTSRGVGADYSKETFGSTGTGYYAYNPTGVLMIVLKEVNEDVAYRTYYRNNYKPGGGSANNIVDTTFANMVKGEWIADEYRYDYYGETIMTSIDTSSLVGPVGYRFVGWYDNVDSEGNGTGNLVSTSNDMMVNSKYYALVNGEKIIIRQNNNLYARWEPVTGSITINKTITGGLTSNETELVKSQLEFVVKNDSNEVVATILPENIVWTENTAQAIVPDLPINIPYTIEEANKELEGHLVTTTITYPNSLEYALLSAENPSITVNIENEYSTNLVINKVNPFGELKSGASFEILESGEENARIIADLDDGNDDGNINISLIKYNTEYIITEKIAPAGHYIFETPVHIKVTKVDGTDVVTILNPEEVKKNVSVQNGNLKVINLRHVLMPKAGGAGTTWFYISGIFLMGISIIIYFKNRKEV